MCRWDWICQGRKRPKHNWEQSSGRETTGDPEFTPDKTIRICQVKFTLRWNFWKESSALIPQRAEKICWYFKKGCLGPGIYTELNVKVHTGSSTWGSTRYHMFEPKSGQCLERNATMQHNFTCPSRACAASKPMTESLTTQKNASKEQCVTLQEKMNGLSAWEELRCINFRLDSGAQANRKPR